MQNLARFWTTSKFGGEYLRKRMKIFKIGQIFCLSRFFPR